MGILSSVFEKNEEQLKADAGFSGNKIEESGIYLCKVTMAKQIDSGSSASKDFALELETEKGAKLFWRAGWYINKASTNVDKNGNLLLGAAALARTNWLLTGSEDFPVLSAATIKEYDWDTKSDISVERQVCRDLVGKFVKVQVVRKRTNKQVKSGKKTTDGWDEYIDGPEEKFTNEVKRFYDASTDQTFGEKQQSKPAEGITKDAEYCAANPVLDKYKAVAAPVTPAAPVAPATSGFGS